MITSASTLFPDDMQRPLEDYVALLSKVKLVRTGKREGSIRARLLGAATATAEILVYLDSHCEVMEGNESRFSL